MIKAIKQKAVAVLLVAAVLLGALGALPLAGGTAYAEDVSASSKKAMVLGLDGVSAVDTANPDTSDVLMLGSYTYNGVPYNMSWYRLNDDGLMLSVYMLDSSMFQTSGEGYYPDSDLHTAMAALYTSGLGLTAAEQTALASTTLTADSMNSAVGDLVGQYVYPLSRGEFNTYIGTSSTLGGSSAYLDGDAQTWRSWWFRSSSDNQTAWFLSITNVAVVSGGDTNVVRSLRPAFTVEKSNVLFTSAADGADKSAAAASTLTTVAAVSNTAWKLTVQDAAHTLSTATTASSFSDGGTITVDYTGASVGDTLSAMVLDSTTDEVLYYGNLEDAVQSESGSTSVTLPADFDGATQTLMLFTQSINGANETDTASAMVAVTDTKHTDADLTALSYAVDGGADCALGNFDAGTTAYNVVLPADTAADATITLSGTVENAASITENVGTTLANGSGTASVTVTAEDGTATKTYTVSFTSAEKYAMGLGISSLSVWDKGNDPGSKDLIESIIMGSYGGNPVGWVMLSDAGLMLSKDVLAENVTFLANQNLYPGSGLYQRMVDYYNTGLGLTTAEQGLVISTTLAKNSMDTGNIDPYMTDLADQKFFPLSLAEAVEYVGINMSDNAETVTSLAQVGTKGWHLRSVALVSNSQVITWSGQYFNVQSGSTYSDRAAFYLDTSQILFTSAAVGGKSGTMGSFTDITASAMPLEWKMTLLDPTRSFAVTQESVTISENVVSFDYTAASTGENEYISAMILGEGDTIAYYAKAAAVSDAAGSASVTLPSAFGEGDSVTVYLFNEQDNGDNATDLSSAFVSICVTADGLPEGSTDDNADDNADSNTGGNTGSNSSSGTTSGSTTVTTTTVTTVPETADDEAQNANPNPTVDPDTTGQDDTASEAAPDGTAGQDATTDQTDTNTETDIEADDEAGTAQEEMLDPVVVRKSSFSWVDVLPWVCGLLAGGGALVSGVYFWRKRSMD